MSSDDANFEIVRQSAKTHAPDRYAAALFAPRSLRDDLIAIAAFIGEIDHIVRSATDRALGEIRLQWWRDALTTATNNKKSGNPVLDAFLATAFRHEHSLRGVDAFIEARADDLAAEAPADDEEFFQRLRIVDGTPLVLAATTLGVGVDDSTGALMDAAASACGYDRLACELPYFLVRGQSPLPPSRTPQDIASLQGWRSAISYLDREATAALDTIRADAARLPKALTTALLPLALIGPHFRVLQSAGHDPTRDLVEIAPLARLWHLARASMSGRF